MSAAKISSHSCMFSEEKARIHYTTESENYLLELYEHQGFFKKISLKTTRYRLSVDVKKSTLISPDGAFCIVDTFQGLVDENSSNDFFGLTTFQNIFLILIGDENFEDILEMFRIIDDMRHGTRFGVVFQDVPDLSNLVWHMDYHPRTIAPRADVDKIIDSLGSRLTIELPWGETTAFFNIFFSEPFSVRHLLKYVHALYTCYPTAFINRLFRGFEKTHYSLKLIREELTSNPVPPVT